MSIEQDSPPRRKNWPRRRWVLLAGLVGLLAVSVPSALAIHDFTDVPDASPFHGDISAVKGAGITAGKTCDPPGTPPTYCPTEDITREAMAAFVHRGFGRTGIDNGPDVPISGVTDLAVATVQVGGVAGQTQFVHLNGVIGTCDNCLPPTGVCPCVTTFYLTQDGVGLISLFTYNTNYEFDVQSGAVTAVVPVPSGTSQTFRLRAESVCCGTPISDAWGELSVMTAPFGSTGANTLGNSSTAGHAIGGSREKVTVTPGQLGGGR